jgi:glutamine cyclotransferase
MRRFKFDFDLTPLYSTSKIERYSIKDKMLFSQTVPLVPDSFYWGIEERKDGFFAGP